MCKKDSPTIQQLQSVDAENWKTLFKQADDQQILELAYLYDAGQTGNLTFGLRAKIEL